jgi:hypothetical protein
MAKKTETINPDGAKGVKKIIPITNRNSGRYEKVVVQEQKVILNKADLEREKVMLEKRLAEVNDDLAEIAKIDKKQKKKEEEEQKESENVGGEQQ